MNTTGFFYDYNDLQVFSRINTGGIPREVLTNAADAEIFGFELELVAKPIDGLDIQLALGLLDSELKDFQTFGGNDFSGNELVNAPQRTFSGLIRKEWPLWGGSLAVQADLHYQDKVFFSTSNDPLLAEDAYSVWNARLAWWSSDKRWEFALWGENLGDREYKVAAVGLSDFGFNIITYGEPRTYGLELRWQY